MEASLAGADRKRQEHKGYSHATASLKIVFAQLDTKIQLDLTLALNILRIASLPRDRSIKMLLTQLRNDFSLQTDKKTPLGRAHAAFESFGIGVDLFHVQESSSTPVIPPWRWLPDLDDYAYPTHLGEAELRKQDPELQALARIHFQERLNEVPNGSLVFFTDGSVVYENDENDEGLGEKDSKDCDDGQRAGQENERGCIRAGFGGAAWRCYEKTTEGLILKIQSDPIHLGFPSDPFECENAAATSAIHAAKDLPDFKNIIVATDCQSTNDEMRRSGCDSASAKGVNALKEAVHLLRSSGKNFGTLWVPSHCGIQQNELVDANAKEAAMVWQVDAEGLPIKQRH